MKSYDIVIIGGGPAGLSAACAAAELGASVLLCERDYLPGGQLVKQTHKFFGAFITALDSTPSRKNLRVRSTRDGLLNRQKS